MIIAVSASRHPLVLLVQSFDYQAAVSATINSLRLTGVTVDTGPALQLPPERCGDTGYIATRRWQPCTGAAAVGTTA